MAMLTEIYIEALLVDEDAADQVWEAWDSGEIDDQVAWWLITLNVQQPGQSSTKLRYNNESATMRRATP